MKTLLILKEIYTLNSTPIKIPMTFSIEIVKITKIHLGAQKTPNIQSNPEQKILEVSQSIYDFKLYYRSMVTKQHHTDTKIDM